VKNEENTVSAVNLPDKNTLQAIHVMTTFTTDFKSIIQLKAYEKQPAVK
jgi:hypothetical protein